MSGIGSVIAGAVGKQIVGMLGDYAASEVTLQWRYREEVLEMEETMKDLEAVLSDADDKSRRGGDGGRVFQRWLTKFKRAAYDVEDVLDELDANDLINKSQSKVFIPILILLLFLSKKTLILWLSCLEQMSLCMRLVMP